MDERDRVIIPVIKIGLLSIGTDNELSAIAIGITGPKRGLHVEYCCQLHCGDYQLALTVHQPEAALGNDGQRWPAVVICHGFVGTRIGVNRLFVQAARCFEQAGYAVVRFDYAGCGESTGRYGDTGLTSMVDQTRAVLEYTSSLPFVDADRITLLGHSLGGAVAMLTAVQEPAIRQVILWAAVAHPYAEICAITGPDVVRRAYEQGGANYLGYTLKPGFFDSLKRHCPVDAAAQFTGNALIVHGAADAEVPVRNASLYYQQLERHGACCQLEILQNADHTFSTPGSARAVRTLTRSWLQSRRSAEFDWKIVSLENGGCGWKDAPPRIF
ncbi:hypothetical protein GCM10025857_12270 [Alicyclobacillus contaminans]|nr:hypothetical protein GCM10025857_12270 [Alicyclobacillus contaminans]